MFMMVICYLDFNIKYPKVIVGGPGASWGTALPAKGSYVCNKTLHSVIYLTSNTITRAMPELYMPVRLTISCP